MIDLTKRIPVRFNSISPETRKEIFEMYLNSTDNGYAAIGEKFGLNHSMIGKIIEVELGERRKKTT